MAYTASRVNPEPDAPAASALLSSNPYHVWSDVWLQGAAA
jgi:hypothetical protein